MPVTIWHFPSNGSKFANPPAMKNFFKTKAKMTTENNDKQQELDDATLEANANGEQLIIEDLTAEEKLSAELAAEKDKLLRLFAEFENFKRRTAKEYVDLRKTASQEVMQAMLPVLDDFDRALAEIRKSDDQTMLKGVELIHDKFKNTLTSKGLEVVEVNIGDVFNAGFAEAITQIPAPSPELKGKIVDVLEKGYKLGDKIIRFPKVVTGQ